MNLLHYAAKSGTIGVGDINTSCRLVKMLIAKGINIFEKCKWTDMSPMHYAVFFDIYEIVEILLDASKGQGECLSQRFCFWAFLALIIVWVKVFKNGPSKICGRQPLKNLK